MFRLLPVGSHIECDIEFDHKNQKLLYEYNYRLGNFNLISSRAYSQPANHISHFERQKWAHTYIRTHVYTHTRHSMLFFLNFS